MSKTRRQTVFREKGAILQCPGCGTDTRKRDVKVGKPLCRNLNCQSRHPQVSEALHIRIELLKDRQEYRRALIYRRGGSVDPDRRALIDAKIADIEEVISALRKAA